MGASLIAEPDDVTGHAAHFGGYLAGTGEQLEPEIQLESNLLEHFVEKNTPGLIFGVHFVRNVKVTKCEQVLKAEFVAQEWSNGCEV